MYRIKVTIDGWTSNPEKLQLTNGYLQKDTGAGIFDAKFTKQTALAVVSMLRSLDIICELDKQ